MEAVLSFWRKNIFSALCSLFALACLFLLLFGLRVDPETAVKAFSVEQFAPESSPLRQLENDARSLAISDRLAGVPAHQIANSLLANVPRVSRALSLTFPNYREDRAVREALLAAPSQWQMDAQTKRFQYRASNAFTVYLASQNGMPQPVTRHESTLLTARILLGLWASRRFDPQLSVAGSVVIRADEVLAWRGVQKHHRLAYPGSQKHFKDGYQTKQKQQVHSDLSLLSRYYICGQQCVVQQGRVEYLQVDSPYLSLTPLEQNEKITGYLVAPGPWFSPYEAHANLFFANVDRQIFQLNPRNDYLALRLAFFLVEHWRLQGRDYQEPLLMSRLLSGSMISVDKANLTSRFAPRVEAALQKLYTSHILGEPPVNLSGVDRSKAHWGHDWLASSWRLVPPQDVVSSYLDRKK